MAVLDHQIYHMVITDIIDIIAIRNNCELPISFIDSFRVFVIKFLS